MFSADVIHDDQAMTGVFRSWPIPLSTKDVMKFLGLTGYSMRLVRGYAEVARPTKDLLRVHPTILRPR